MEKVTLPKQNSNPNFIGSWMINSLSICDELINYFEANKNKQKKGVTSEGEQLDIKNCDKVTNFSCARPTTRSWLILICT